MWYVCRYDCVLQHSAQQLVWAGLLSIVANHTNSMLGESILKSICPLAESRSNLLFRPLSLHGSLLSRAAPQTNIWVSWTMGTFGVFNLRSCTPGRWAENGSASLSKILYGFNAGHTRPILAPVSSTLVLDLKWVKFDTAVYCRTQVNSIHQIADSWRNCWSDSLDTPNII